MPEIAESGTLKPQGSAGGNMQLTVITPGIGSSGEYSEAVLQDAGESKVFPKGTLCFADHPSESERFDRPERSLRDVAGVLVEDAYWDGTALVAEVKTYDPWTQVLAQMADAIGVSIRAQGEYEEAAGGGPPKIAKLTQGISVDFVTQAGRGGAIRQVYESARGAAPLLVVSEGPPIRRRSAKEIAEALPGGLTANDLQAALDDAVQDAYGGTANDTDGDGPKFWTYIRDWSDTWVVFSVSGDGGVDLYQQGYTAASSGAVSLTGDRVEVQAKTTYVPLPPDDDDATNGAAESARAVCDAALLREASHARAHQPPSQPAGSPTPLTQGATVPHIEESRLQAYQLAEARVPQLERELAEAKAAEQRQAKELAEAKATTKARDFAVKLVESTNPDLGPAAVSKVVAEATRSIPLTDDLQLDTEALTATVNGEREAMESFLASVATQQGMGTVRGVGPAAGNGPLLSESQFGDVMHDIFV